MSSSSRLSRRGSGLELLKIGAIFLIVLSHICQSLSTHSPFLDRTDYLLPLQHATSDPQLLALSVLRYGGALGNTVFFLCSCWFLLDSARAKPARLLRLVGDVWLVSWLFLGVTWVLRAGNVDRGLLVQSLMPLATGANWYITCYALFYAAHPMLNRLLKSLSQQELRRCCIALTTLYLLASFLKQDLFFGSYLTVWLALYFDMAYLKWYLPRVTGSRKWALGLMLFGLLGNTALILLTNALGRRLPFFSDKLLQWCKNSNPLLILGALGAFLLAKSWRFQSRSVNYVSSLSLLVYLLHENTLFRSYFRPRILLWIYDHLGYERILLQALLAALALFLASLAAAAVYKATLGRLVEELAGKLEKRLKG